MIVPDSPEVAALRRRVTHLEVLLVDMDSAHAAFEAGPTPEREAACERAYGAIIEEAEAIHARVRAEVCAAAGAVADDRPAREAAPSPDAGPLRVEPPPASRETVRVTLLWTGAVEELDLALLMLREGLTSSTARGPRASRGERLARAALAHQILNGALGEDRDEDESEPHEHLGVVRWERTR